LKGTNIDLDIFSSTSARLQDFGHADKAIAVGAQANNF